MQLGVLVFLGGGCGAVLRWAVGLGVPGWTGVLVVNAVGSFALAALAASPVRDHAPSMALLATGLLGGFTTYSTFNAEIVAAASRGQWGHAALQLGATVGVCLVAGAAGLGVGAALPR